MRRDRIVVEHGLRGVHELLAVLDVTRVTSQRMHEPEFGQREADRLPHPEHSHAIGVDLELTPAKAVSGRRRLLERIESPEQGGDARHQVRQADVLGQIVVGAETQARHGIELAVPRGQKDDRQICCA